MALVIRPEQADDYRIVENVNREAFWNVFEPGANEHYLVHLMRQHPAYLPKLSLVAMHDGEIVGSIHYAQSYIEGDDGEVYETVALGPVAVLPAFRNQGIGKQLIEHSAKLARELGYRAIGLYGDPDYYSKHGFRQASEFDIRTPDDAYLVPLQLLELYPNLLSGITGRYFERATSTIEMPDDAVADFDSQFPAKEKISGTDSQKRFAELVAMRMPRHRREVNPGSQSEFC